MRLDPSAQLRPCESERVRSRKYELLMQPEGRLVGLAMAWK